MNFDPEFLSRPSGQFLVVGVVVTLCGGALFWQHRRKHPEHLPETTAAAPALLPRVFTREGVRITPTKPPETISVARTPIAGNPPPAPMAAPPVTALPLTVFAAAVRPERVSAPFGRLVPCETVTTLESNRLDTPVIGLVTEDVWHDGRIVIPAGTEVHGRAALDHQRERIAVAGSWMIVWRRPGPDNGTELSVQGLALDRGGESDGTAGLRGQVIRSGNERELKLFAATFLSAATLALQDLRTSAGPLGESALPAATARNATLAGTAAVLRDYAAQIREAVARDGVYLRVPAGKPFYLYVTETLNRSLPGSTSP